jgi:hypothetical protein
MGRSSTKIPVSSPVQDIEHVPYKRLVEIGEGAHFLLVRKQLFDEITLFLKESSTFAP